MNDPNKAGQAGAGNLIVNGVLAYFFYTYAFNNPDAGECWAISTSQVPKAVETAGYKHVSAQFHTWFLWGFILNVAMLVMAVLQFLLAATKASIFGTLNGLVGCPVACGGLAWFITGMVWRWREIGKVCAGVYALENGGHEGGVPYQWKSGKFMHIYNLICLIGIGCVCCCACVCAVAMGGAMKG